MTSADEFQPDGDFDEMLIEKVRLNPVLYDATCKDYRNPDKQSEAWLKIAGELHFGPETCKIAWRRLREKFRKISKQSIVQTTECDSSLPIPTWPLYESMTFLKPFMKSRRSKANTTAAGTIYALEEGETAEDDKPESLGSIDYADTSLHRLGQLNHGNLKRHNSPCGFDASSDAIPGVTFFPLSPLDFCCKRHRLSQGRSCDVLTAEVTTRLKPECAARLCEEDAFGISVAGSLKRMNAQQKELAKMKIQTLLYEILYPS